MNRRTKSIFKWYLFFAVVFVLLVGTSISCFGQSLRDTNPLANDYDDWSHFGLGGCAGGLASVLSNPAMEPVTIKNKRTGQVLDTFFAVKKQWHYDFLPGLIGGILFEGVNWLRHPQFLDVEHTAFGLWGATTDDFGCGIIMTLKFKLEI